MKQTTKNVFAFIGAIFFAFAPTPMHAVTGAAAFYSYNVLSVTFFLLSLILFKIAFIRSEKKFIYFSVLLLFGALFTKETAAFLFLLLPFMVLIEKRAFQLRFLAKLFVLCVIIYAVFRFLVPNITHGTGPLIDKLVSVYISSTLPSWQQSVQPTSAPKPVDTGTIVSRDLSIHKNLPAEILFRTVTFPIKMTGTLFFPRQTVFSIVQFITPIVQPVPPGGDSADSSQARLTFSYGPGNGFIIYTASLVILIFCVIQIFRFVRRRQIQEAQTLTIGLAIIVFSALPLVAIIFSFPRWGYDFYFDSRHYYNPNVGAAIIFPFLLLGITKFISKSLRIKKILLVALVLFIIWLINNMYVFNLNIKYGTQNFQPDRRKVVEQLKKYLPSLPKITVFYIETDGLNAYGPTLPFQTGVAQALTVVYYDRSPLPDSFFDKPLFSGKGEGYQYSDGRGFGYYTSKKNLSRALLAGTFKISDIHAYYFKAQDVKLLDRSSKVRAEMENYLFSAKENLNWKVYRDPSTSLSFYYPPQTEIGETPVDNSQSTTRLLTIVNPEFTAKITIFNIAPSFVVNDYLQVESNGKLGIVNSKKVSYDRFQFNDTFVLDDNQALKYLIHLDNKLIVLETQNVGQDVVLTLEKILGSFEVQKPV